MLRFIAPIIKSLSLFGAGTFLALQPVQASETVSGTAKARAVAKITSAVKAADRQFSFTGTQAPIMAAPQTSTRKCEIASADSTVSVIPNCNIIIAELH